MTTATGKPRMEIEEIEELLKLKGWTRTKLAGELGMTENAIHQWFSKRRNPGGPAAILMRMWLDDARNTNHEPGPKKRAKVGA